MRKMMMFLLIMSLLALPTSVTADSNMPIGERINIHSGDLAQYYPAGAPFYLLHGWTRDTTNISIRGMGIYDFKLEIDGVYQRESYVQVTSNNETNKLIKVWVFNFPTGMTGTHTFTGHWFGPCESMVLLNDYPGPCSSPYEKVEALTRSVDVTFTPTP